MLNAGVANGGNVLFLSFGSVAHGQANFLILAEKSGVSFFQGSLYLYRSIVPLSVLVCGLRDLNTEGSKEK